MGKPVSKRRSNMALLSRRIELIKKDIAEGLSQAEMQELLRLDAAVVELLSDRQRYTALDKTGEVPS